MSSPKARGALLAAALLLLAFALYLPNLKAYLIGTDELYSLGNLGAFEGPYSPSQILASLDHHSPDHPPLYFLLGAAWAAAAGWSQFSMRLLSLLGAMLFFAWSYRAAADLAGRRAGLAAVSLLLGSAFLFDYLYAIRMYSLLLLLCALHVCLFWRLLQRDSIDPRLYCGFLLSACAMLYTHVFALVPLLCLGAFSLFFAPLSRKTALLLAGWLLAGLTFLPYLPVVAKGFSHITTKFSNVAAGASGLGALQNLALLLSNGMPPLLLAFAGLACLRLWRVRERELLRWALFAGLTLLAYAAIDAQFGFLIHIRSRYMLLFWLPFAVLCAAGIAAKPPWNRIGLLCLLLYCAAGFQFYRGQDINRFRGGLWGRDAAAEPRLQDMAFQLPAVAREQDFVLGFAPNERLNSARKHGYSVGDYYLRVQLGLDGGFVPAAWQGPQLEAELPGLLDSHPHLLVLHDPRTPPSNFSATQAWLARHYRDCGRELERHDLVVQRHARNLVDCERGYQAIQYETGIKIVDKFGAYDADMNLVRAVLGWEVADEALLTSHSVSIQIIRPDWRGVAQAGDRYLDAKLLKWQEVEISTADLPPGEYRVVVIVYERANPVAKLEGIDLVSGETGSILEITRFTIAEESQS